MANGQLFSPAGSSTLMSFPPTNAQAALVLILQRLQVAKYFAVLGNQLLFWDYCLTFSDEVKYIWHEPWRSGKTLFLLTRCRQSTTSMSCPRTAFDSDSENDGDYVPPVEKDSSSSDKDKDGGHCDEDKSTPRLVPPTAEDAEAQKAAKHALWASFQAAVASEPPSQAHTATTKAKVTIEKRYRFAGEDVIDVVEVEEDCEDAKRWPRACKTSSPSASASTNSTPRPPAKRPGPRRPKVTLAPLPWRKAKKLSTLEKSAMDWRAHVAAEAGSGLQEELDVNRKGGGYLEKVDFLGRVDGRKDGILEASRSSCLCRRLGFIASSTPATHADSWDVIVDLTTKHGLKKDHRVPTSLVCINPHSNTAPFPLASPCNVPVPFTPAHIHQRCHCSTLQHTTCLPIQPPHPHLVCHPPRPLPAPNKKNYNTSDDAPPSISRRILILKTPSPAKQDPVNPLLAL
ncbi:hypothetical protein CCMSSC00406_0008115 [Pleurotus cornucopiae]|uniref:Uncharacterized protein n=1 Tax=Pleurotus cornucopiae TaxID=5321 RepID=A0ACB7IJZ5_PLECO|nr:hypothetical protein CCMSSC00406_0008115 [Pleurotus cornucopiae]